MANFGLSFWADENYSASGSRGGCEKTITVPKRVTSLEDIKLHKRIKKIDGGILRRTKIQKSALVAHR